MLKKKYSVINSLHFFKSQKIVTKCLQYERVVKIFLLSYFEYCQIWLNILMDDCHLRAASPNRDKTLKNTKWLRVLGLGRLLSSIQNFRFILSL
jgi:hypothetical protein